MITTDEIPMRLQGEVARGSEREGFVPATLDVPDRRPDTAEGGIHDTARLAESLDELWTQVEQALTRLKTITEPIAAQAAENDRLRRENTALKCRLAFETLPEAIE